MERFLVLCEQTKPEELPKSPGFLPVKEFEGGSTSGISNYAINWCNLLGICARDLDVVIITLNIFIDFSSSILEEAWEIEMTHCQELLGRVAITLADD